jgi:hypothetical protein
LAGFAVATLALAILAATILAAVILVALETFVTAGFLAAVTGFAALTGADIFTA